MKNTHMESRKKNKFSRTPACLIVELQLDTAQIILVQLDFIFAEVRTSIQKIKQSQTMDVGNFQQLPHHYIVSIAPDIALTCVQDQMLEQCLRTAEEEHRVACSQQKDHLWPLILGTVVEKSSICIANIQEQVNIVYQHRQSPVCWP